MRGSGSAVGGSRIPLHCAAAEPGLSHALNARWVESSGGDLVPALKWRLQCLVLMGFSSYLAAAPASSVVAERMPAQPLPLCDIYRCTSTRDSRRNAEMRGLEIAGGSRGGVSQAGNCPRLLPAGLSRLPASFAPASPQSLLQMFS